MKHILGTKMGNANRLSRRLNWKVGVENDNENKKLIKEEWIWGLIEVVVERAEVDILEKIKKAREKDDKIARVVKEMKKVGVKVLRNKE